MCTQLVDEKKVEPPFPVSVFSHQQFLKFDPIILYENILIHVENPPCNRDDHMALPAAQLNLPIYAQQVHFCTSCQVKNDRAVNSLGSKVIPGPTSIFERVLR